MQLATLTKHQLVGDLLYGTVFNYFALNDLQDTIAAQSAGILNYRLPSYGTFSTNLKVQYLYGLPRQVEFSGLSMDIDKLKNQRVSKTNNKDEGIAFSQSIGARQSAMEHLVPEQMFSTETEKAQGISTVKALAIASAQGQKIWTISQQNLTTAMSQLMLSAEAENDIRNAVNAGKVVTAHEQRINFYGWVGEGYSVIDPKTGAGGYLISGGGNGSETQADNEILKPMDALSLISDLAIWAKKVSGFLKKVLPGFFIVYGIIDAFVDAVENYKKCGNITTFYVFVIDMALTGIFFIVFLMGIIAGGFIFGWFIAVILEILKGVLMPQLEVKC